MDIENKDSLSIIKGQIPLRCPAR